MLYYALKDHVVEYLLMCCTSHADQEVHGGVENTLFHREYQVYPRAL